MLGGGDARSYDYEIYQPYYLLLPSAEKPVNLTFQAPLPTQHPTLLDPMLLYGQQYNISCNVGTPTSAVQKAVLISPGSMTHASDMHQRYVELATSVTVTGGGLINQVQFVVPANDNVAPRGLYMLWLVTNTGAVSEAIWVLLQ